jgi:hypothetical protein
MNDTSESAPEGFTQKVMTRITLERVTRATRYESPAMLRPLLTAGAVITVILFLLSALPGSDAPSYLTGFFSEVSSLLDSLISDLNLIKLIPDMNLTKSGDINYPTLVVYLTISIALLTIFDRILNHLFMKRRESRPVNSLIIR